MPKDPHKTFQETKIMIWTPPIKIVGFDHRLPQLLRSSSLDPHNLQEISSCKSSSLEISQAFTSQIRMTQKFYKIL